MNKKFIYLMIGVCMSASAVCLAACDGEITPEIPAATLDSIEAVGEYRQDYTVGETFSADNLSVRLIYSDNTFKWAENFTYEPAGALTLSDEAVTVKAENMTCELPITVSEVVETDPHLTFERWKIGLNYMAGGIDSVTGEFVEAKRLPDNTVTAYGLISLDLLDEITVDSEHIVSYYAYDGFGNYIGNAFSKLNRFYKPGTGFTASEITGKHPNTKYIRFSFRNKDGSAIDLDDYKATPADERPIKLVMKEGVDPVIYDSRIPFYVNVNPGNLVDNIKNGALGSIINTSATDRDNRAASVDYIPISEIGEISCSGVNPSANAGKHAYPGYLLGWCVYDENFEYLGCPQNPDGLNIWNPVGHVITQESIRATCEELEIENPVYLRFNVKRTDGSRNGDKIKFVDEINRFGQLTVKTSFESQYEFVMGGFEIPEYVYSGEKLMGAGNNIFKLHKDSNLPTGVGEEVLGAVAASGNYLFSLTNGGTCLVYNAGDLTSAGQFKLSGGEFMPAANSASFGSLKYAEGDEFPLLYVNTYGDNPEVVADGQCFVYRIIKEGNTFTASLVQIIKIDVNDKAWSDGYGDQLFNFVADGENLYIYTVINDCTRYFKFNLPAVETDGVKTVTLTSENTVGKSFETDYMHYMSDGVISEGLLYSVEGYGIDDDDPGLLRVIDIENKQEITQIQLDKIKIASQPKGICILNGKLCVITKDGGVYRFEFGAPANVESEA